jgi:hypothetical protein
VAECLAFAEAEKILCSQIEIGYDEIFIQSDQCDAETAKNLVRAGRTRTQLAARR